MNTHIDISGTLENFKKHFLIEGNSKIVFSAKYGTGKSYFLKNFFEDFEIEKNYYPITLSPVNYVVSSNEDIFDLIKVDIIKHLYLDGNLDINRIGPKISTYSLLKSYAKKKPLEIVRNISACLSKVSEASEAINEISESVIKLLEDFEKFEKKLKGESKTNEEYLHEFADSFVTLKKSYLEHNFITQIIITQLENLFSKGELKKKVLVLEDFDRLDPAHIFRILNIFSAHQSDENGNNKFGFDKIVLVCDLDNIEHIYKHFYGEHTDFEGYINKFYSFEPYYFDNRETISYHLKNVLKVNLADYAFNCLVEIISFFIREKKLTIRKVLQTKLLPEENNDDKSLYIISDSDFMHLMSRGIKFVGQKEVLFNKNDLPILTILRILKNLFGNYDKLSTVLENSSHNGYGFRRDNAEDIYKALAFTSFFTINSKNYRTLLFKSWDKLDFQWPEINMNGHLFRLEYKWRNGGDVYQRDNSYFKGMEIIRLDNTTALNLPNANYIFSTLNNQLSWLRSNNYLYL